MISTFMRLVDRSVALRGEDTLICTPLPPDATSTANLGNTRPDSMCDKPYLEPWRILQRFEHFVAEALVMPSTFIEIPEVVS